MSEGVDYAWGRPGGAALKAAGKHFVMRYVPYAGDGGKGLLKPETADLRAHGLSIGLVFETTAGRARDGYAAGQNDARLTLVGLPQTGLPAVGQPVYFAVDFDANVGQRTWDANFAPAIQAYLLGASSVLGRGRVGVYGSYYVIEWALSHGYATWGWQTYAWSYGHVSARAHLIQYDNEGNRINGVPVDLCRSLRSDFGQYPRTSLPDTALPPPPWTKRADGDHSVRYQRVDYTRVLKSRKPVRKGVTTGSGAWKTYLLRKTLRIIGRIDASDLPAAERQFGDVLITQIDVGGKPGYVFGYVKQVDIVGN